MTDLFRESSEGVYIKIKVYPDSKIEGFTFAESVGLLKVRVNQPAAKDKANKRVLELLKEKFGDCVIVSGHKTSRKTVLVKDKSISDIKNELFNSDF